MERYVKLYRNINEIKDMWESLYSGGTDMAPYQSFEWNRNVAECYRSNTYIFLNYNVRYFVLFKDKEPLVIAPLALPKNKFNPETYTQIFGEYSKTCGLNLVYGSEAANEDFQFLIEYIQSTYSGEIRFCNISSLTKFGQFLGESEIAESIAKYPCVRCDVPQTQSEFIAAMAENAKKAEDILNDSGSKVNVEIYHSYKFGPAEIGELAEIREKSLKKKKHNAPRALNGGMKAIKKIQRKIFKNKDTVMNFANNENFIFSHCVIDGKTAGFFCGITDRGGRCIVPEMVVDSDCRKYLPELLMIYEFIKDGIENESLTVFDFSKECEKYKIEYIPNPQMYFNFDYRIEALTLEIPTEE